MEKAVKGKAERGTHYKHCFSTIDLLKERFTLSLTPLFSRKDTALASAVKELIEFAKRHIEIKRVFLDREYFSTRVIHTLLQLRVKFVLGIPKNERVKGIIEQVKRRKKATYWTSYTLKKGKLKVGVTLVVIDKFRIGEIK